MSGTLKKVRFKRAWQSYRVGDEITPNGTLRQWLVEHGYVDIVAGDGKAGKAPVNREVKTAPGRRAQGGGKLFS